MLGMGFVCILTLIHPGFAEEREASNAMKPTESTGQEESSRGLTVKSPRCEYRVDPPAIDEAAPRLSWMVESSRRAQRQTAYRVLVADSLARLEAGEGNLWDSGKVASSLTSPIVYEGKPLASRMQCFWKVQVWDEEGSASAWSEPARWTMGLLKDSDWRAEWIGVEQAAPDVTRQEDLSQAKWIWFPKAIRRTKPGKDRYFRRAFQLSANRAIRSAICRISADNNFTLFVNGTSVGQGADFTSVTEIDLAAHLRPGYNVLAVEAGNTGDRENPAGLIASLRIEWAEGDPLTIVTDAKWKAFQEKSEYWAQPDFSDDAWPSAKELGEYGCSPWSYLSSGGLYLPPVKYLRKAFTLSKPVKRATFYATALGLYEAHLNGRKVSEDFLTPGWTDYQKRVYYNTYDVTELLKPGEQAIGVLLADGWYSGYVGWGRKRDHDGKRPWFRAQLEIEYMDGSKETIGTDRTWRFQRAPCGKRICSWARPATLAWNRRDGTHRVLRTRPGDRSTQPRVSRRVLGPIRGFRCKSGT
jgi:alpha-L-rhamnosidase